MKLSDKIYVAGHRGLAGSAILRALQQAGYTNLVYRTHDELDLTQQKEVNDFFESERPDFVFLAAAKVGGIHANNTYRGEFIYNNLAIQSHVIEAARRFETQRLLFLGTSCIYPRLCPQPMKEEHLLSGYLEPTNEPYAVAKIAGIKLCEAYNSQYGTDFVAIMPTNLYGPHDNFDLLNAHALPALIRKVHEAKINHSPTLTLWGTGVAQREFLHSDDMASAALFIMNKTGYKEMVNVGTNEEVSIRQLAETICDVAGYEGKLVFDTTKPDGSPRKLLDVTRLTELGWKPKMSLKEGLKNTYAWFVENWKQ